MQKEPGKGALKGRRFRHPKTGCPITWPSTQKFAPFLKVHFWLTIEGQFLTKMGAIWLLKVPERAAFGTQSLAAQLRDLAPRTLRPFLKAHFWLTFEGHLPTKVAVVGCKKCPKRPLSTPEVWLPNHVILHPGFCAFHKAYFWLTFVRANSLQK